MPSPTVLMVHGAWHGAWCWDTVNALLAEAGVEGVAIDLPGHGDDPGAATDLHGDADRVREALDHDDGPVVLVGHSYGGAVITEAGAHPRVRHLVYIAALNIDKDETANTAAVAAAREAGIDHRDRLDIGQYLERADDGRMRFAPEGAKLAFYNDCPDDVARWATSRLVPQAMENLAQTPRAVAWRDRPSTYAVCTLDAVVHPDLQRVLAERAAHRVEWPTGHSPFLSRPELVAQLLVDLTLGA